MSSSAPNLDSVTTINTDGSRNFIYPSDVRGRLSTIKIISGWLLITVYILLPWIPINGNPAIFLDLSKNQFHLFGLTFVGQDLWMGFFALTGAGFTLFCITALFGRLWCGWTCPQTVFIEQVYRRLERWIEGPAHERRKTDQEGWTPQKTLKRILKHFAFALCSVLIAHVFISYFVSIPTLFKMMSSSPLESLSAFVFVFVLSGILHLNFAWFREQFCIILCPYGRLQSALIDDHSIVVGYDQVRGEPRGKKNTPGSGDCVDCHRCVQVCPTGIDIRQGLQLECVSCANCIDACNEVMTRMGKPSGLIRHDSMNALSGRPTRLIRPRTILYSLVVILWTSAFVYAFSHFKPVTVSALRMVGAPYYLEDGKIRNQFMIRILNKKPEKVTYRATLHAQNEEIEAIGLSDPIEVEPMGEQDRVLVLRMNSSQYKNIVQVSIRVESSDGKSIIEKRIPFLGPDSNSP